MKNETLLFDNTHHKCIMFSLEDHGGQISFGSDYLRFIPANFLHSPGNFLLYDSRSTILFSGDIGAAIAPQHGSLFHDENVKYFLEWFESVEGGAEQCEALYGCGNHESH